MKSAAELHENVPANWYFRSLKESPLQRYWHQKRFEVVEDLIEPAEEILDIGCADGVFTNVVAKETKAKRVVGIDALESSVAWANKHWNGKKNIKFVVGDAHKLGFPANSFDAVFALEVLEHVYHPEKVLKEIKRVLKKGGYAILLVPTESLLFKVVWFLWHYSGRMVWEDTHVQSFRNDKLVKIARKAGFKVEVNYKFHLGMLQAIKVRKK
jgi:ubiquinone/menaquinone biosynthesis C-methylase UbiE